MEERTASLRTYMLRSNDVSGNRVETLSSRPSASSAWSNLLRSSGVHSIGGRGGKSKRISLLLIARRGKDPAGPGSAPVLMLYIMYNMAQRLPAGMRRERF